MSALHIPALAIVVAWIALRLHRAPRPRATAQRFAVLATAAWLVEQSMIRAHGYYFYSDGWWLLVGHVPLLVVVGWAVLIDAAWSCSRRLAADPTSRVILCALLVGIDIAIAQPLGVHTGLVRWNATGPMGVPPIAFLGPAIFAGATARLCLADEDPKLSGALADALAAVGSTHLGVLVAWHVGLGHFEHPTTTAPLVIAAALLGACAAVVAVRRRAALPPGVLGMRALLAVLFVIAALVGRVPLSQWFWAAGIGLPWIGLALGDRFSSRSR